MTDLYRERFGEHIPLIRRQDVKGFITRKPLWLAANLPVAMIRREVEMMEEEARNFYQVAIAQTSDAGVRQLLGDLASEESKHYDLVEKMDEQQKTSGATNKENESERRRFVLQIVQPGLAGLMDGSVSTLAPVFAAAFATHTSKDAFLVGMAASVGAGISMGFAEAMSDDGVLSGRGRPWARGDGLRSHDHGGRHRSHASLFNFRLLLCNVCRCGHRRGRTRGHRLDSPPLHGYATAFGGLSGHRGRRARFHCRHLNRLCLVIADPSSDAEWYVQSLIKTW